MQMIGKNMGSIVKSLESSLNTGNLQKMWKQMDQFEKQFVNMEAAGHAIADPKASEKVDEDDLTRRLAELKARG
uniref:Uncharacterized protein n=1 Tax=Chenopodium quinoa TaxID=63459 RepID=A0A803NF23_CHEQI